MNEKIKELLPNPFAVDYIGTDEPIDLYTEKEMLEFANVIIQDCVKICDKVQIKYGQYTFTARICKEDIKQHFGVEE